MILGVKLINWFFALAPIGIILISAEFLHHHQKLQGEFSRKFIHILSGLAIAIWPVLLPYGAVLALSALAALAIIVLRFLPFAAINSVPRRTMGDLLYALSVLLLAWLANQPWIFSLVVLIIALPDGLASIIGQKWAKRQFLVFGWSELRKSPLGTVIYILVCASLFIVWPFLFPGSDLIFLHPILFAALPVILGLLEMILPYGIDNFVLPMIAMITLNILV